jgi:phospholipid transport system substrate-binding protein
MKRFVSVCVFLFALSALAPTRAEVLPDQIAREVTDQIVKLIKANREAYARDYKKLYAMVDEHILPHFDFRKMAQQVLGPTWRSAAEEQRARFTAEFRELLVRTYGTALLKYTNEEIVYLPLKIAPNDPTATVKSQIRRSDGAPPIAINYSFYRRDAVWKIYDMAIEGPSIVTTYQRVYAERLQKEGLDALIANLAQANRRALAAGSAKAEAAK